MILYRVPLKRRESVAARDALAKTLYNRTFDFIVMTINKSIPFDHEFINSNYIGVLDVAGFGSFLQRKLNIYK